MSIVKQMIIQDGILSYKCKFCDVTAKSGSVELGLWEALTLHFADAEHEILLCKTCKKTPPNEMLEQIEKLLGEK